MERLAIRSDAVILEKGKLLVDKRELIGDWIKEGDECEDGCKRKAKEKDIEMEIVKPLHPMIRWGRDDKGEKAVIVSLNYLAELKGEKNGR